MAEREKWVKVQTGGRHVFKLKPPIEVEAQAATLLQAAASGVPFCEECEKAKRQAVGQG